METLACPPGTVIWVKVRLLARTWEVVRAVALAWLHWEAFDGSGPWAM